MNTPKQRWENALETFAEILEVVEQRGTYTFGNGSIVHREIRDIVELARGGFVVLDRKPGLAKAQDVLAQAGKLGGPNKAEATAAGFTLVDARLQEICELLKGRSK